MCDTEVQNHRLLQVLLSSACGCFIVTVSAGQCANLTKFIGACWVENRRFVFVFPLFGLHSFCSAVILHIKSRSCGSLIILCYPLSFLCLHTDTLIQVNHFNAACSMKRFCRTPVRQISHLSFNNIRRLTHNQAKGFILRFTYRLVSHDMTLLYISFYALLSTSFSFSFSFLLENLQHRDPFAETESLEIQCLTNVLYCFP